MLILVLLCTVLMFPELYRLDFFHGKKSSSVGIPYTSIVFIYTARNCKARFIVFLISTFENYVIRYQLFGTTKLLFQRNRSDIPSLK
jgi:hypothetical protein